MVEPLALIGKRIKERRQQLRLTVEELARRCRMSKGQLSKIENARTLPWLPMLVEIARQIELPLEELVKGADGQPPAAWRLLRRDDRKRAEREESVGMEYLELASLAVPAGQCQIHQLTVAPGAKRRPLTTDGRQIVIVTDGRLEFVIGEEVIQLADGDVLEFDGRVPHVPRNPYRRAATVIAVYLLNSAGQH